MKLVLSLFIALLLTSVGLAQKSELPAMLTPSQATLAEASRLEAKAFKILPRNLVPQGGKGEYYKDEEWSLGVRGNGAYYSFTTGSHSYNKVPEIGLEGGYLQAGGFAGLNYGLMKDLGKVPIESVSLEQPEVLFLATYKPRNVVSEIRAEQAKRGDYMANGFSYRSYLTYSVDNTYVLRAISYDNSDTLIAFKICQKLTDGSLEIVWKELKNFPVPRPWYFTDAEMTEKLNAILSKEVFAGVKGEVNENVITIRGITRARIRNELQSELHTLRALDVIYLDEIKTQ